MIFEQSNNVLFFIKVKKLDNLDVNNIICHNPTQLKVWSDLKKTLHDTAPTTTHQSIGGLIAHSPLQMSSRRSRRLKLNITESEIQSFSKLNISNLSFCCCCCCIVASFCSFWPNSYCATFSQLCILNNLNLNYIPPPTQS